jgi:hypothetical protein
MKTTAQATMKRWKIILIGGKQGPWYQMSEQITVEVQADTVEIAIVLAWEKARRDGFTPAKGRVLRGLKS